MTAHCANSACGANFRYFRSGKIYLIDFKLNGNTAREMEYFWLCGDCSPRMRVTLDSNAGDARFKGACDHRATRGTRIPAERSSSCGVEST